MEPNDLGLIMKSILLLLLMVSGLQFACGAAVETDPARDESFLSSDGKADATTMQENTPEANGLLRLVNEASLETLDDSDKVGLDARAARNIVEYRVENRGIHSLAELDSIGYVGRSAFLKIFEYALNNGYFSVVIHRVMESSPQADAILDIVNVASQEILDADVALDSRAAQNIVDYRQLDSIDSLAELDRIGYVGKSAFDKLVDFTDEDVDPQGNIDAYLQQMARDFGEYFFFERTQYEGEIREISQADVTDVVLAEADRFAQNVVEQNRDRSGELQDAEASTFYVVKQDGVIIGYVINVEYYIDHPLFDGGGTHLYLNTLGEIVADVEWWG